MGELAVPSSSTTIVLKTLSSTCTRLTIDKAAKVWNRLSLFISAPIPVFTCIKGCMNLQGKIRQGEDSVLHFRVPVYHHKSPDRPPAITQIFSENLFQFTGSLIDFGQS